MHVMHVQHACGHACVKDKVLGLHKPRSQRLVLSCAVTVMRSTIGTPLAPSWDVTNITMNMGPNEYVQSVQGWTAGLDGGILSLTFTTNLGNVIRKSNPRFCCNCTA